MFGGEIRSAAANVKLGTVAFIVVDSVRGFAQVVLGKKSENSMKYKV